MIFKFSLKKIVVVLVLILMASVAVYFYAYKSHRNIADEAAVFSIEAQNLKSEFNSSIEGATQKYANETIIIYGIVSMLDLDSKIITLNENISVQGIQEISTIQPNQKLTIKGRLVGYDDLLEEIVIDQATIQNSDAK